MSKTAVAFRGQGKLDSGAAKEAYYNSETAKEVIDDASVSAKVNLARVLFGDLVNEVHKYPQIAPAAADLAVYEWAKEEFGLEDDIKIGMSAGEMIAVGAAGAFRRRSDLFSAIIAREEAMSMSAVETPGRVFALIGASKEQAKELADRLGLHFSGTVLSNHQNIAMAIERAKVLPESEYFEQFRDKVHSATQWLQTHNLTVEDLKIRAHKQHVPPSHTILQEVGAPHFYQSLQLIDELGRLNPTYESFLSNTSEQFSASNALVKYLGGQLTNVIDLPHQLDTAHNQLGVDTFIEINFADSWTPVLKRHFPVHEVVKREFGNIVRVKTLEAAPSSKSQSRAA
jgi:hypothetical protein